MIPSIIRSLPYLLSFGAAVVGIWFVVKHLDRHLSSRMARKERKIAREDHVMDAASEMNIDDLRRQRDRINKGLDGI